MATTKSGGPMRLWWSKSPAPGNFGDVLTPLILRRFGIAPEWTHHTKADAICIGSIAKFARPGMLVLGSGTMRESDRLEPRAKWLWARGPHTRKCVIRDGGQCPEVYGDPAMLLPVVMDAPAKKYDLGVVPHYVDYEAVSGTYRGRVINPLRANPLDVARDIAECRTIISSSLHGLIAAHAFGIPAAWVRFSDKLCGDDTKFHDHYGSMGLEAEISTLDDPIFQCGSVPLKPMVEILEGVGDRQVRG